MATSTKGKECVLAFDVGSACTGFAFGIDGTAIKWGKYIADTKLSEANRLLLFSKWVSKIINGLPSSPNRVVVESPYFNKKSVRTHAVLNKYVGVVQREVFRILKIDCEFVSPSKAKKEIGVKSGKNHKERKRNMVNHINKLLGLELNFHNSNKKKSDDDIADALCILMVSFGFSMERESD